MNKKRMGQFLRKLRKDKNWSQEDLAKLFNENYFDVSVKAISDWENGKTIAEIEKLKFLSSLYGTSIDEILDGETRKETNYFEEYVFADNNIYLKFTNKDNIYEIHQEHKSRVIKRFNTLLKNIINGTETKNEEDEFKFLFEHFYKLSDYAENYVHSNLDDNYLKLFEAIRNKLVELGCSSFDEKYFEITKFIIPTDESNVRLDEIMHGVEPNSCLEKRFKLLAWWEKDMLLMSVQKGDIVFDPSKFDARALKRYEDNHGREFDKDECVREAIKYMIDNGACLNYQFINLILKKKERHRIIDRIEEWYLLCEKPLPYPYRDEGKDFTVYAENNRKNRFVINYFSEFKYSFDFLKLDIDQLYDFLWKYDPEDMTDELFLILAKGLGIDTNREMKYIRADVNGRFYALKRWKEYRAKEKEIESGALELRNLEERLKNGEIYYFVETKRYVGATDSLNMMQYFEDWKSHVSLKELSKMRNKEKTKELIENLSSYSLGDLRNVYFKEKVIEENETNE